MNVALAVWNGRISPVFDVSRRLLLLEVENGSVVAKREREIESDSPERKAATLADWKVRMLICGALSRPLNGMLNAYGIETIPFIAGDVEEVIAAYIAGTLPSPMLTMPGCCGGRARFRGSRCRQASEVQSPLGSATDGSERRTNMPRGDGTGPSGRGPGTGRGMGQCGSRGAQGFGNQRQGLGTGAGQGRGQGQGQGQGKGRGPSGGGRGRKR